MVVAIVFVGCPLIEPIAICGGPFRMASNIFSQMEWKEQKWKIDSRDDLNFSDLTHVPQIM